MQGNTAEQRFDVVSVKRFSGDRTVPGRFDFRGLRAGTLVITAMSLRDIIAFAYPETARNEHRLIGGDPRLLSTRFDIEAKFDPQEMPPVMAKWMPEHVLPMVRTLLQDRFALKTHSEIRDVPVFAMVLARSDKRLGPGLRRSTTKCPPPNPPKAAPGEPLPCDMIGGADSGVKALGMPILSLAEFLVTISNVGREVVDETGLTGLFDFTVTLDPRSGSDSILTALQEQLGLKLVPKSNKLGVQVIDNVELPTPN